MTEYFEFTKLNVVYYTIYKFYWVERTHYSELSKLIAC